MRNIYAAFSTSFFLIAASTPVSAASLQVSPVSVEVPAPGAVSTVTLNNPGDAPLKAQIRIFKWSLINGEEHLEPATDVVASPPMATLPPKTDYTVRVVRLNKQPAASEETYRLIIDEIPDAAQKSSVMVKMAFRYSIPTCRSMVRMARKPFCLWTRRFLSKMGQWVNVPLRAMA